MRLLLGLVMGVSVAFSFVDINHADAKQLMQIKGIGEAKALRVIEYIKQNGCFNSVGELTNVKGIGNGLLSKNMDNIKIVSCKKDKETLEVK